MTNHNPITETTPEHAPRFLTAEQIERLTELVDGAIFAGTSHLISAVQHDGANTERTQRLASIIENDRRLKVFLGRLTGK